MQLTTRRAEQLCNVLECRLQLLMEVMKWSPADGGSESVLPEAEQSTHGKALMRQSTGFLQRNVRVTASRESRYPNPYSGEDPALGGAEGARFDDEVDTSGDGFEASREAIGVEKAEKAAKRSPSRPGEKGKAPDLKQAKALGGTEVYTREQLKARSAAVLEKPAKSPSKKR